MGVRLASRLDVLRASSSSVEAEVHLAAVFAGQAVESQGPVECLAATSTLAVGGGRGSHDGAGVLLRTHC